MGAEELSLTWDDHHSTLVGVFEKLLESSKLVDCTIAAEGQYLKAHKVVLSGCSPYFELLFSQENEKNPIVVLKDIKFQELKAIIDFVYRGKVKIPEDRLGDFVAAAESLQIKGLGGDHNKETNLKKKEIETPVARKREGRASPIPRKRIRSSYLNAGEKSIASLSPVTVISDESNSSERPSRNDKSIEMSTSLPEFTSRTNVTPEVTVHRVTVPETTNNVVIQPSTSYVQPVQSSLLPLQPQSLFESTESVIKTEPEPITEIFLPDSECLMEPKDEVCEEEESLLDSEDGTANADGDDTCDQQSTSQYAGFPTSLETSEMGPNDSYVMAPVAGHSSAQVHGTPSLLTGHFNVLHSTRFFRPMELQPSATAGSSDISTLVIEDADVLPTCLQPPEPAGCLPRKVKAALKKHCCPSCNDTFQSPSKLTVHLRKHTGERPYKCDVCGKAFSQSTHLRAHHRLHTGERPCNCQKCGKDFVHLSSQIYHVRHSKCRDVPLSASGRDVHAS